MPECDYCEASFADEEAYLDHLEAEHRGELGRIDRRRVEARGAESGFSVPPIALYAVGGIGLFLVSGAVVYFLAGNFFVDTLHEHGTIQLTVDNQSLSFSEEQYTRDSDFHFHGSGPVWHMHPDDGERMTLSEAMADVGIELTADSITVEGETYDAADEDAELAIRVNGEPVDPESYELHEDDRVVIVVETGQG